MKEEMNFNYNECIKSYDKLGETIYVNICNNEKTNVPWGFTGWGTIVLIGTIILCFLIMGIYIIKSLIEDLKY